MNELIDLLDIIISLLESTKTYLEWGIQLGMKN